MSSLISLSLLPFALPPGSVFLRQLLLILIPMLWICSSLHGLHRRSSLVSSAEGCPERVVRSNLQGQFPHPPLSLSSLTRLTLLLAHLFVSQATLIIHPLAILAAVKLLPPSAHHAFGVLVQFLIGTAAMSMMKVKKFKALKKAEEESEKKDQ